MSGTFPDNAKSTGFDPEDEDPVNEVLSTSGVRDLNKIRVFKELLAEAGNREERMFEIAQCVHTMPQGIAGLTNSQDQMTLEMENYFKQLTLEMQKSFMQLTSEMKKSFKQLTSEMENSFNKMTSEMEKSSNQMTLEMQNSSNQTKVLISKNMDHLFENVNALIRLLGQQVTAQLVIISEKISDKNVRYWTSTLKSCIVFVLNVAFNAFITSVVVYYCVRDPSRIPGIL